MLMAEKPELTLAKTLQAQTTCIGWSSQTDFGLTPAPSIDGSLLAAGNRAGSITFLRFLGKSGEIQCVETVPVSDRWVNHLAWSSWRAPEHGMCEALLACGCTDGSVILVKVVQSLSSTIQFASDHELKQSFEIQDVRPCEPDGRGITGMKWVDVNAHGVSSVSVFHKSGMLHLWSGVSAAFGWSGSRALLLRTQKLSDALVVSLSDGSFHVVHNLSVEPSMDPPPAATGFTSGGLSAASRSVYLKTESEQPQFKDVNCINGMMSYDGGSMFVWIYESSQLWNDDIDSGVLDALAEKIAYAKAVTGEAPISLLRPVFLHLREPQRLSRLYLQILEILRRPISEDTNVQTNIPPYSGELSIFRIRLSVATFCQKHSSNMIFKKLSGKRPEFSSPTCGTTSNGQSSDIWPPLMVFLLLETYHLSVVQSCMLASGSPADLKGSPRSLCQTTIYQIFWKRGCRYASLEELCQPVTLSYR
ncbi:hypothetical protein A0H81_05958 [Grifola frondosa]|uniref:Uncharacterized protein n=1 Tax=Grifola frondosa TaxID=5627 RepID=A0A1C7MBB3_GRIFR|nr:hypothetical protein A0H81_05958 [Grifola frondosa]